MSTYRERFKTRLKVNPELLERYEFDARYYGDKNIKISKCKTDSHIFVKGMCFIQLSATRTKACVRRSHKRYAQLSQ